MPVIFAIDPGSEESGYVVLERTCDGDRILEKGVVPNAKLQERLDFFYEDPYMPTFTLVVEDIVCYNQTVGKSTFDTCIWAGRFDHRCKAVWISRPQVYVHLCGNRQAKPPHIRAALIGKWGGENKAIGGVKCRHCKGKGWRGRGRPVCPECEGGKWKYPPGPLAGVTSHVWAALALAVTYADQQKELPR